ncbi:TRAP transporter substrate-binding protein DctP [Reinekea thalattae]|uniref:C4-dicarboxylate ABC transporter n=1 Tax=Reinekea thalattae TaxID=2593301 RepID=A0A5C8ZB66_9GAMM|nr:TRAP transporter substrate-binding protein DctP [Reinekea thalattae]TXR54040.1 C4-dicarboxylate ABC transporter [Reinekea thalattae]
MKLAWITLTLCGCLTFANATVLKIATEYPDGNAILSELRMAGERIEQATEGRVSFKFYPGGVMGDALAVRRKIRIGQLNGTFIHSTAFSYEYKNAQVLNAPLLFRSFEEVDLVRAQFDDELNQGFIDSGWHTFGLIEGGFAYLMSANKVHGMEQLKQQKLWLPANDPLSEKIAKAFEINPFSLSIGDVLTGLQTGALNAFLAPPTGAIVLQWYTQADYLLDAPFMYIYGVIALSERTVASLSESDFYLVEQELTALSQRLNDLARAENIRAFDALSSLGISTVSLDDDFRHAIESEADEATDKLISSGEFDRDLYQRISDVLTDYRNP